jgi:membrane protein DedA with SNARE-associated domain
MLDTQSAIIYFNHISYLGVYFFAASIGYAVPIPEEIFLVLVGYAIGSGLLAYGWLAIVLALAGVLTSDLVIYFLSRGGRASFGWFRKGSEGSGLKDYEKQMRVHAPKTIFVLRFIPGLRFASPVLAGSTRVNIKTFLAYDFLAAIFHVPFLIALGYHFAEQLNQLIDHLQMARHIIFLLLISIATAAMIHLVRRYVLNKKNGK